MVTDPLTHVEGISLPMTVLNRKLLSGSVWVWMNEMALELLTAPIILK